jgi:hypothetical protein
MDSYETKLYETTGATAAAGSRVGQAVSGLDDYSAPRVLAPEHQGEHGSFGSTRFYQHEAVDRSIQVAEDRTVFLQPRPCLLIYGPQNQSNIEIRPRDAVEALNAGDGGDLLEVEGLPREIV